MGEILFVLIAFVIYWFVRSHGDAIVNAYNRVLAIAMLLALAIAPILVLLFLFVYGWDFETMILGDFGPFTALLLFEVFLVIKTVLGKIYPQERPEDYVPYWNRPENQGVMIFCMFAISIGFFVLLFARAPMFFTFLELTFGVYFFIKGFL